MASANDFFHKVGRSTATTLSSPGYTTGDTSINVASTTNWPSDTGVTFAIDEVDGDGLRVANSYNVFRGNVAGGTQIDEVVYVGGDANRNYSAGVTTRVYILVSSFRDNRFTDGVLVSHEQDGTLKAGAVDSAAVLANDVVETAKIKDGAVTGSKITNYKIVRQNDTTNSTETTSRILTGWGVVTNAINNTQSESVTFNSAFSSAPIVIVTCAGDKATNDGYGSGGVNLANGIIPRANAITTTGFNVTLNKADGTNFASGYTWYTWIAVGV